MLDKIKSTINKKEREKSTHLHDKRENKILKRRQKCKEKADQCEYVMVLKGFDLIWLSFPISHYR